LIHCSTSLLFFPVLTALPYITVIARNITYIKKRFLSRQLSSNPCGKMGQPRMVFLRPASRGWRGADTFIFIIIKKQDEYPALPKNSFRSECRENNILRRQTIL